MGGSGTSCANMTACVGEGSGLRGGPALNQNTVLAVILLFIVMSKDTSFFLFWPVTLSSVLGVTALSLLELFVAFLQAYIFAFLASLFLGMALHPQH